MEKWARLYQNVRFLTVCVDVQGVALQFGRMFNFKKVVNCHIPSREYFPRGYGQLGCSGFIMSDPNGCFVTAKTKAYLQYGDRAFQHVEQILLDRFEEKPACIDARDGTAVADIDFDQPVPSVGIQSMDAEHQHCEEALSKLQLELSPEALDLVYTEFTNHFAHEEHVMKVNGFGSKGGRNGFSPLTSHINDHRRILDMIDRERTKFEQQSCSPMQCSSERNA